ncbi:MAG: (d)CMP kinase [Patescibacteria group bacterium]|nr:(d)CMP kinase [Patescibacteria group bacterium]
MIISISGAEGSGKSTIAKMLAAKLGWPRYYIGGIRREKAKKRGLTLAEYNKLGETDPSTDLEVDEYQKKLGETSDNFIMEGRTSWHFIPQSFKIYLDVSFAEGAKRIFGALQKSGERNEGKNLKTYDDVLASIRSRRESDKLRYAKYFGIDVFDLKNYDFVLDTTNLNIDQVFKEVLGAIENKLKNEKNV